MPNLTIIPLLLTLTYWAGSVAASELVWLESERFGDPGGWTVDAQFIDQMGSPYL
ncbi:MAG: hypothetical protein HQ582_29330, partial [Planctomycetes bacterium]|nr:hypothetical protein [Planctomycetota bacterium]